MFPSRFPTRQLPGVLLFALLNVAIAGLEHPNGGSFYPVTTTADSGAGSLRNAIAAVDDGDTVYFAAALNGQTINLTSGELAINKSITITGPGPNLLTVSSSSGTFRIFHVLAGPTVRIQGLTIRGGRGNGGGIRNDHATLSINNCTVSENFSANPGGGGGIYNDGSGGSATMTIVDSTVTGNRAYDTGGGIYNDASNGGSSTLSLWNSSVSGNIAAFTEGFGGGTGGGIANEGGGGNLTLTNSIVSTNYAGVPDPFPIGNGGGIYNNGTLTLIISTIKNNQGFLEGGGIYNGGALTIINSTISGNGASGTHDGEGWGLGGGILNNGTLRITNSTLSNNYAAKSGGGIDGSGTITNSTLSGNTANQNGGGIFTNGGFQLGNTILKAGAAGANISGNAGTVISLGYNLSSDNGGGFLTAPGDQINTDPILGPLQDNGGSTFTHELLTGSPAINTGDPNFTPPPLYDQRGPGYPRVFNARLDIGSLEAQPALTPSPTPSPTPTPCGLLLFLGESFDTVTPPALPPGWVSAFTPGPANCTPTGTCALGTNWATSSNAPNTPPHYVFHNAPGCVTDSTLDTLSFTGGATNGTFLSLRHSYDLENGRDGAVLEISINGGPFVDFVAAGGGSLGYNGTISSGFFSPIAGRAAWTGNSGGYVSIFTQMPLSALGKDVRLRFRLATDCSGAGTGWRIDSIVISDNIGCPTPTIPPPPPSPTPTATLPPPTATPIPTPCGVIFSQNFDDVTAPALPAGWATSANGAGVPWETSTTFPTSGVNDAFASPAFNIGNTELVTPVIGAPTSGGILSFQNLFNLQGAPPPSIVGYDGMVLEISINSGPYTDVIAAGGSFVTGGYTHTITNDSASPIAGRMAWSGVSAGATAAPAYITTTVTLPATTNGQNVRLKWRLATDGNPNNGLPVPGVRIDTIILTPASCAAATPTATIIPTPTPSSTPAQALNISTRMLVQTAERVGIGGFIVTGGAPKQMLLRAIGPSLAQFGVPNVLADPVMELHGPAGFATIINDNWRDTQAAVITATGIAPINDLESAILVTLDPGNYTAIVRGKNDTSGVGLVEVYDLDQTPASKLANISTRAFVSTGDNVMIAGFILGAGDSTRVLILATGPSLAGSLADPTLELRDSNGALLASNDDCGDSPIPIKPPGACIDISLPPGAFTATLAGKNGGTGIGLVEIYNLN